MRRGTTRVMITIKVHFTKITINEFILNVRKKAYLVCLAAYAA